MKMSCPPSRLNEAGVNHLLVSGSKGEPVGMVSSLKIIKLMAS
jgi:predicted transcriptional regulator